jgi:Purple acid Phosphatase, N-terminal domain
MISTRMRSRFFIALLMALSLTVNTTALAQVDQTAPQISSVQVSGVTENSATITWSTNENADSLVNYGLQPDYGILRTPIADRKAHSMTLENLEPGRVYYFRVVSADSNGNQGISADYRVQTSGTPSESSSQSQSQSESTTQSQTQTTQEVVEKINEITNPEQLKEILNETVKAIKGISEDLTIVGPPTVIPENQAQRYSSHQPQPLMVGTSPIVNLILELM